MTSHLSIDEFFTQLSTLFDSRRNSTHGSICLTQKRLIPFSTSQSPSPSPPPTSSPTNPTPFPDLQPAEPLPLIIRATNSKSKLRRQKGEKIKLSTIVEPDEVEKFFVRYAEVLRAGMSSLKKRDRSGRKKKKEKDPKKKEGKDEKG